MYGYDNLPELQGNEKFKQMSDLNKQLFFSVVHNTAYAAMYKKPNQMYS